MTTVLQLLSSVLLHDTEAESKAAQEFAERLVTAYVDTNGNTNEDFWRESGINDMYCGNQTNELSVRNAVKAEFKKIFADGVVQVDEVYGLYDVGYTVMAGIQNVKTHYFPTITIETIAKLGAKPKSQLVAKILAQEDISDLPVPLPPVDFLYSLTDQDLHTLTPDQIKMALVWVLRATSDAIDLYEPEVLDGEVGELTNDDIQLAQSFVDRLATLNDPNYLDALESLHHEELSDEIAVDRDLINTILEIES